MSLPHILLGLLGDEPRTGYDLARAYPGQTHSMLLCVTELHTRQDIDQLVAALGKAGA